MLESSGEINQWDRESSNGQKIKRPSLSDIRVENNFAAGRRLLTNQATRRKLSSVEARISSPAPTIKTSSMRITSPMKIKMAAIPVKTIKRNDSNKSSLREHINNVRLMNQHTPITFPMDD